VTSTTHVWPSGDTDGGPTRLTFQRSSAVIGRGSPGTAERAQTTVKIMTQTTLDFMVMISGEDNDACKRARKRPKR
jgi:hypothetical protein